MNDLERYEQQACHRDSLIAARESVREGTELSLKRLRNQLNELNDLKKSREKITKMNGEKITEVAKKIYKAEKFLELGE